MGIEGFVVLGAAILLIAYVIPTLAKRRVVLADTPIEDRFAEDLRMLEVSETQPAAHRDGQRGSVFFRRPEVEMAGRELIAKDVRELARDRSRARARIAKRGAFVRRGLIGALAAVALAAVAWIVVATTSVPVVVAAVATALVGAYAVGFGYLRSEIAKADAADHEAIARIDAELGPRRARGRRRASDVVRARAAASERVARAKELTEAGAGEAIAVRGGAQRPVPEAGAKAAGTRVPGERTGARRLDVRAELAKARMAERASAANAARSARRDPKPSPRAEMPSYTLKPRKIERRVVEPYSAPTSATAPVPYRPQGPGERYDAATGVVMPNAAGASGRSASGQVATVGTGEAGDGAHGAQSVPVESAKPVISTRSAEVLGGGSVLDALLDRRRA